MGRSRPNTDLNMRTFCAITLLVFAGCAGHLSLAQAITAHNLFSRLLSDASDAYTPLYATVAAAELGKPQADADYYKAMKPYDDVVYALRACQEAENAVNGLLAQCVAAGDGDCSAARTGFACAASALDLLSTSYGQIKGGAPLYAATAVAKAQLIELANGATCEASYASH